MTFNYIGIEHFVADQRLDKFGQSFELSEQEGVEAIIANVPMLPYTVFDAIGFTKEELSEYAYPGPRSECSKGFAEKWKAARVALHEIRERLKMGGDLNEVEGN